MYIVKQHKSSWKRCFSKYFVLKSLHFYIEHGVDGTHKLDLLWVNEGLVPNVDDEFKSNHHYQVTGDCIV